MFLIQQGSDLNAVNKNGHTPLAFDNENLLRKLNLINGISTTKKIIKSDNNKLLITRKVVKKPPLMKFRGEDFDHCPY
jgi:hypothetical protein